MKIINNPENWKDLQNKVGEILSQFNFKVDIERKVKSIRSEIEIDVYAEENIDNRRYLILCECKMWNSNIPQLYVHGLRTVINDIGANKGYIISTSDFQKGSINSVESTNVELLNWQEFQKVFFKSWYVNYFSKQLALILKSDYDCSAIQFYDNFTKIERNDYRILIEKYNNLQEINNHFPSYLFKDLPNEFKDFENKLPLMNKLKLEEWEIDNFKIPKEIMEENHYSNFLKLIFAFAKPICAELDQLDLFFEYDD